MYTKILWGLEKTATVYYSTGSTVRERVFVSRDETEYIHPTTLSFQRSLETLKDLKQVKDAS